MTLPDERYRAVKYTKEFLMQLASGEFPRTPRAVRSEAYRLLRHYPNEWDLKQAATAAPDIFQERIEPVYRLILEHTHNTKDEPNS